MIHLNTPDPETTLSKLNILQVKSKHSNGSQYVTGFNEV